MNVSLNELRRDWRYTSRGPNGRRYGFPICCQVHFYLDVLRGRAPATRRGTVKFGSGNVYVPCAICRRRPRRWRVPSVLAGPVVPARYVTWEQSCAECGLPPEVAARYVR